MNYKIPILIYFFCCFKKRGKAFFVNGNVMLRDPLFKRIINNLVKIKDIDKFYKIKTIKIKKK